MDTEAPRQGPNQLSQTNLLQRAEDGRAGQDLKRDKAITKHLQLTGKASFTQLMIISRFSLNKSHERLKS